MSTHKHEINLRRTVHVPLGLLWEAWTDPEQLSRWFTEKAEHELRVGGRYTNSDGDCGEFLVVEPHRALSFTWEQPDYAPGSIVTVRFQQLSEEASELALEHTDVACDDEADLRIAWNWALDALIRWLEEDAEKTARTA